MSAQPLRVYWRPGCSSCVKVKEFLAQLGVPYESIDVAARPQAMEELRALGVRTVPVVGLGERAVESRDRGIRDLAYHVYQVADAFLQAVEHGVEDLTAVYELLERWTWHSAQHARQIIAVLERLGIEPDGRLTAADYAGLPLPAGLWE